MVLGTAGRICEGRRRNNLNVGSVEMGRTSKQTNTTSKMKTQVIKKQSRKLFGERREKE